MNLNLTQEEFHKLIILYISTIRKHPDIPPDFVMGEELVVEFLNTITIPRNLLPYSTSKDKLNLRRLIDAIQQQKEIRIIL